MSDRLINISETSILVIPSENSATVVHTHEQKCFIYLDDKIKDLEEKLQTAWIVIKEAGYEDCDLQLKKFMEVI